MSRTLLYLGITAVVFATTNSSNPGSRNRDWSDDEPLLPSDLVSHLRSEIASREYWASEVEAGLQAPNRAQGLRSFFEPTGVRIHDRSTRESEALVELRVAELGRGSERSSVAAGDVSHVENRVEIERAELGLIEWFENTEAGLEQGFTLARPPGSGPADGEPMVLDLSVTGARAELRGDAVVLASASGRNIDYGKLVVEDAKGVRLVARFEVPRVDRVRIVVDDREATYPIVIDPLIFFGANGTLESYDFTALLGTSIASAGDVDGDGYDDVIVGAPGFDSGRKDQGLALVFHGGPGGVGFRDREYADGLIQSDQTFAQLGTSVASAGDVNGDGYSDVIVGAPGYDDGQTDEGAAFVFLGSVAGVVGTTPSSAHAILEGDLAGAAFGADVAPAGDVNGDGYSDVIVGAPRYTAGEPDEGAAFAFLGGASGMASGSATSAHARFESNQGLAQLGTSVASAGDVDSDGYSDVIVGAPYYDNGLSNEGAAFVFRGSASGLVDGNPATADAVIESDQVEARLGISVASAGDVDGDGFADVLVGAPFFDIATVQDAGAAFLFRGSASGPSDGNPSTAHSSLTGIAGRQFGGDLSSAGDVNGDGLGDVIIASPGFRVPGAEGGWDFYLGSSSGLSSAHRSLLGSGGSVAAAGDVNGDGFDDVIVGVPTFPRSEQSLGVAYVYHGGSVPFLDAPIDTVDKGVTRFESNQAAAMMGAVASAGDVNRDGYGDVIIGVPGYDAGETDEGAAFVFLGSETGIADANLANANAVLQANQPGASFGDVVASAGDVNGDGYGDVIVAATRYDAGQNDEGAAFVFLGSASGIESGSPSTAHPTFQTNQANGSVNQVSSAGDVNGDGYGDVIVGSSRFDAGQTDEGAAFVLLGSATGVASAGPAMANARIESNEKNALLGWAASTAGDVNGDGYADVIVGVHRAGTQMTGAAFVIHGAAAGIPSGSVSTVAATRLEWGAGSSFGYSVSTAGDVDGDGYDDVVVGAPSTSTSTPGEGAAFVYFGSPSGVSKRITSYYFDAFRPIEQAGANFGVSVAAGGDLDGDGYGDIVVGADRFDSSTGTDVGTVWIQFGRPRTSTSTLRQQLLVPDVTTSSGYGRFVAGAGDVNGDGFGDLLVGASLADVPTRDEGAAYLYLGNTRGRSIRALQRRVGGTAALIPAGGAEFGSDRFAVELFARSPRGRERAKLEVEVCPVGVAFRHATCMAHISPAWMDLGTTGAVLAETVTGLRTGDSYRWRARALFAPFHATQSGIVPIDRAGPWFRVQANSRAADIRFVPEPAFSIGLSMGLLLSGCLVRKARRGERLASHAAVRPDLDSARRCTGSRRRETSAPCPRGRSRSGDPCVGRDRGRQRSA